MQGKDYQQHGPRELPEFSTGVRKAIDLLGISGNPAWRLWGEADAADWGGAMIFERL